MSLTTEIPSLPLRERKKWATRAALRRSAVALVASPNLLSHHVARWAEAERQLVAVLAERRGTDAANDRHTEIVVATTLSACRVAMLSWCAKEGAVRLLQEMMLWFEVLETGLSERVRTAP